MTSQNPLFSKYGIYNASPTRIGKHPYAGSYNPTSLGSSQQTPFFVVTPKIPYSQNSISPQSTLTPSQPSSLERSPRQMDIVEYEPSDVVRASFPGNKLSPRDIYEKMKRAQKRGQFYNLDTDEYIPLSEEYWSTNPNFVFLVDFHLAGTFEEVDKTLQFLGYDDLQIDEIFYVYLINERNYRSNKAELFERTKELLEQKQSSATQTTFIIQVLQSRLLNEDLEDAMRWILRNLLGDIFDLVRTGSDVFYVSFDTAEEAEDAFNLLQNNLEGFGFQLSVQRY